MFTILVIGAVVVFAGGGVSFWVHRRNAARKAAQMQVVTEKTEVQS